MDGWKWSRRGLRKGELCVDQPTFTPTSVKLALESTISSHIYLQIVNLTSTSHHLDTSHLVIVVKSQFMKYICEVKFL